MAKVLAFPPSPRVLSPRATVSTPFSRLIAIAGMAILLIAIAGLGFVALRPERTPRQLAVIEASPTVAETTIPQFLIDWAAARSSGDVNQLSEFYVSPDIEFQDVAMGVFVLNRGQFRRFMSDLTTMSGKPTYTVTNGFIDGTYAVAEWTETGTDLGLALSGRPPSGKPFTIQGASVFELRDGKIAVQHDYYDLYGLLDQIDGFYVAPEAATPIAQSANQATT